VFPSPSLHNLGTPRYDYDLIRVKQRVHALRDALPERSRLLYSFKANPLPPLAEATRQLGCAAEITSEGELEAARQAGFDLREALFGGPAKTESAIRAALAAGVRWFSCENWSDLDRVARLTAEQDAVAQVLLRVNPAEAPTARLAMTGVESQFGFDEAELLVPEARARLRRPGLRLRGVHVYFGTQVADVPALVENTRRALEVAARLESVLGFVCSVVNAGGGFPWPYASAAPEPDLAGLRPALEAVWRASPLSETAELWFESGRHLVASAGTLVTRVLAVKVSRTRRFILLDTGIHHLGGMAGLGRIPRAPVHFQLLADDAASRAACPALPPADVVGPLCTPLDSLARGLALPEVREGDLLAISNVGAYGLTASLVGFLSHPPPLEVVHRNGEILSAWRWRGGHEQVCTLP
jgi:diaminopimelate decarboxylase